MGGGGGVIKHISQWNDDETVPDYERKEKE